MDNTNSYLKRLINKYKHVYDELRARDVPQKATSLGVSTSGKYAQFFYYTKDPETGNTERNYIKNENVAEAKERAQSQYLYKLNRLVTKRLKQLSRLMVDFEEEEIERVYVDMHPAKQELIKPVVPTRAQRVGRWKATPYVGKQIREDQRTYKTNNEELVRSKSEKIMADMFAANGIVYKYECPIKLGGHVIYPDFTFLDPSREREIYWEHFGMMDNPSYAEAAINRIEAYHMAGIFDGKGLIYTFESSLRPLSVEWVEALMKQFLL